MVFGWLNLSVGFLDILGFVCFFVEIGGEELELMGELLIGEFEFLFVLMRCFLEDE